jgi:hypothetical protein
MADYILQQKWTVMSLKSLKDKERQSAILESCENAANDIINLPSSDANSSVFLPGGWYAVPKSKGDGHAMVYEFKKDAEGNLIFLIYNY